MWFSVSRMDKVTYPEFNACASTRYLYDSDDGIIVVYNKLIVPYSTEVWLTG